MTSSAVFEIHNLLRDEIRAKRETCASARLKQAKLPEIGHSYWMFEIRRQSKTLFVPSPVLKGNPAQFL
ncbi:hypothetical protein RGCCGE502_33906 (plasmid) [Rhizobium grahamii CCGE 502]|uniref:Uncharacterized protein n=1 Tax=Rhizobium grahamii CCGE 502 TaxID=990285 RepID=S3H578_9HYPH|nr:hypothetical protein RGCCGE502_33906 [Rhizobium grahamii CCGE 502]